MRIPFSQSEHPAGDGPAGRRCEEILEKELGAARVLLTPSGTAALELAALTLDIQPGDEVIVPAFTFPTTASAFALRGADIVFCDIRSDTLNLDCERAFSLISDHTAAIVPVHYAGIGCDMEKLLASGVAVVEDNAQGLFGRYHSQPLGSFGELSCLSFHATKNITCGEGGALVVNDPLLVERAEVIRDKGTDRKAFERGEVPAYTWQALGSSFVLAEELAEVLLAQLADAVEIQMQRSVMWLRYDEMLAAWATGNGIRRPTVPPDCLPSWHLYYLLLPDEEKRDRLIAHLAERGIQAVFHYQPLNRSEYALRHFGDVTCPIAESAARRIVRLPLWIGMPQDEIIDAVLEFRC